MYLPNTLRVLKLYLFRRNVGSSFSLRLPLSSVSLPSSIMSTSCPLLRFGHFFFTPTPFSTPLSSPVPSPFSTPLSSPRAWNSLNNGIEIAIVGDMVAETPGWVHGPHGDTGGPRGALADEIAEAVHEPRCGCYWCCRGAYLQVHFARPDDPLVEPARSRYADPLPPSRSSRSSSSSEPRFRFLFVPDLLSVPPRMPVQSCIRWHRPLHF